MIFTLKIILGHFFFNIIDISLGLIQTDQYDELYNVCEELYKKGALIVSAYDNDGAISYPAAFPFIIGIDISDSKLALTEYEYVEGSIVNIRASYAFHRLK